MKIMQNYLVTINYKEQNLCPIILVNDEEISRYSELADLIFEDIYEWAERFYEIMDGDLGAAYCVKITGFRFQYEWLKYYSVKSIYCKGVEWEELECNVPLADKYAYAFQMNQTLNLGIEISNYSLDLNCQHPEDFAKYQLRNVTLNEHASEYYLTQGDAEVPDVNVKCVVCIADEFMISISDKVVRISFPHRLLQDFIDYVNYFHYRFDFMNQVFEKLKVTNLTPEQHIEFEAYLLEKIGVFVEELPSEMEEGEVCSVKYNVYPKGIRVPLLVIDCSNPNVMTAQGNLLTARGCGDNRITVKDDQGVEYYSRDIQVIHHTYVTNISLIVPVKVLQINESVAFKAICTPSNSEDISSLSFAIDNEKVGTIINQNEIYALSAGKFRLTATTGRVSESMEIVVLPKASGLKLSKDSAYIELDMEDTISCEIIPENVSPKPAVTWVSNRNDIVQIRCTSGYECVLRRRAYGEVTVTCSIDGTDISKSITIESPMPKKKACYIATAVYGSYDCPEVWTLRRFRDYYLEKSLGGRIFIKSYYTVSPNIIKWFGETKWFNSFWKKELDRLVEKLNKQGYEDTPYDD